MVLQQQHTAGSRWLRPLRERSLLVGLVHDAEAVEHHVGLTLCGREAPVVE